MPDTVTCTQAGYAFAHYTRLTALLLRAGLTAGMGLLLLAIGEQLAAIGELSISWMGRLLSRAFS
jgi:hypothetical protein